MVAPPPTPRRRAARREPPLPSAANHTFETDCATAPFIDPKSLGLPAFRPSASMESVQARVALARPPEPEPALPHRGNGTFDADCATAPFIDPRSLGIPLPARSPAVESVRPQVVAALPPRPEPAVTQRDNGSFEADCATVPFIDPRSLEIPLPAPSPAVELVRSPDVAAALPPGTRGGDPGIARSRAAHAATFRRVSHTAGRCRPACGTRTARAVPFRGAGPAAGRCRPASGTRTARAAPFRGTGPAAGRCRPASGTRTARAVAFRGVGHAGGGRGAASGARTGSASRRPANV